MLVAQPISLHTQPKEPENFNANANKWLFLLAAHP